MEERTVKHAPNRYDDILMDIVWSGIKIATRQDKPE